MVDQGWNEYKILIMTRLDDLSRVEREIEELKIKVAVLSTRLLTYSAGITVLLSSVIPLVLNFVK